MTSINTTICQTCGLGVANLYRHNQWHATQDHRFNQIATALNAIGRKLDALSSKR